MLVLGVTIRMNGATLDASLHFREANSVSRSQAAIKHSMEDDPELQFMLIHMDFCEEPPLDGNRFDVLCITCMFDSSCCTGQMHFCYTAFIQAHDYKQVM